MILDNKRTLENIDTFTIVSLCLHSYYAKVYPQIQAHNKKKKDNFRSLKVVFFLL